MPHGNDNSEQFLADQPERAEQIRQQLARILASERFGRSKSLPAMLRFVVEETLAGRTRRLKARTIAVTAFGRSKDFDPRTDPIVSIQAGRLRRALSHYYEAEGADEPIIISVPRGRYVPHFKLRAPNDTPSSMTPQVAGNGKSHSTGMPAVAVCQFVNLSAAPEQDYFAAGITQEIATELTRFQELSVLACQRPPHGPEESQPAACCGCDFATRFALRGTTRRESEAVRITAQLVDVNTGRQIWAESHERKVSPSDLFAVQEEIAQRVVRAVADNYGVISRTLAKEVRRQSPKEFSSYEAILRFRYYQFVVSDDSREIAIRALEQAVQCDPEYALAWAMLSETTADAFGLRIDTSRKVIAKAKEQARRALSLDPECQHAHWAMAYAYFHARQREPFIREAEETIVLNPNNGYLVGIAAWAMALAGQWERGLSMLRRLMESNPHYPTWFHLAPYLDFYHRGEYEQAFFHAEKFNTELAWDAIVRAAALGQLGRREDAQAAVAELETRFPNAAADPVHYVRGYIFLDDLVHDVVEGLRKAGWEEEKWALPSAVK